MDSFRQQKVQKFEEFVDLRLKPDLVLAIAQRDKLFQQQKVLYVFSSDLKRNIENLQNNEATSLRTLVNIGSEVYAQADVPDTRHIFVDVGLGFHVEFTWSEALEFISVREARIARQIEGCTQSIASIKSRIKLAMHHKTAWVTLVSSISQMPLAEALDLHLAQNIEFFRFVKAYVSCSSCPQSDIVCHPSQSVELLLLWLVL